MDKEREQRYNQAIKYYKDNPEVSINNCAKKFMLKPDTLSKRLKALGINTNRRRCAETLKEQKFIDYYIKSGLSVQECADRFDYSKNGAYLILRRNNIPLNSSKEAEKRQKQIDLSVEYYAKHSLVSIATCAKKFNVSRWLLKKALEKNGVTIHNEVLVETNEGFLMKKKNSFWKITNSADDAYFSNIDTEEKAYWLGFILADGYITKRNSLRLSLQIRDFDHLHRFKKALKSTAKIKEYQAELTTTGKKYSACSIEISSAHIVHDLEKNNIFRCKSKHEQPSTLIPESLIRHYIRGFFDGDGWISEWNRKNSHFPRFEVGFGSSEQFLQYLVKKIEEQSSVHFGKVHSFSSIYKTVLRNQKEMIMFVKYLYRDCHVYLPRKYEKALELCRFHSTTIEE